MSFTVSGKLIRPSRSSLVPPSSSIVRRVIESSATRPSSTITIPFITAPKMRTRDRLLLS
ncbi:hypothetical protein D3C83_203140 [compost metagenome]